MKGVKKELKKSHQRATNAVVKKKGKKEMTKSD